jgi:predicted histone-like DNA-binding protein
MQYKVIERTNPQKRGKQKKWYANSVKSGNVTAKAIAKEIAGRSSLTRGDIESVLSTFLDELPTHLAMGKSVKLGELGSLRLSISSEGVDSSEEFSVSNIKGMKVIFTPSVDLKKALKDIHFEKKEEREK